MKPTFFSLILFSTLMCLLFLSKTCDAAESDFFLRNNLTKAQRGDYLVTAQHKNYTVLLIRSKDADNLSIDEITLPMGRKSLGKDFSWRKWVESGAPGNTCWVMYTIHLPSGSLKHAFSFTKNQWFTIPKSQDFLSTLLNLPLKLIPERERKKVGPPPASDSTDRRSIWQPQMFVEGQQIKGVAFNAFRTRWPKDGSELSGRIIEVYLPKDSDRYPAHFPYWLQINGMVGKAKVRIIDSGNNLFSPINTPQ